MFPSNTHQHQNIGLMIRVGVVAHFTSAMGSFVSGCCGSIRTYAAPSLALTLLPRSLGLVGASSIRMSTAFASRNPPFIASTSNPSFGYEGCGQHYYRSTPYQDVGKKFPSNKRPHLAGSPSRASRPEVRSNRFVLVFVVDVLSILLCCNAAGASIVHEVLVSSWGVLRGHVQSWAALTSDALNMIHITKCGSIVAQKMGSRSEPA